MPDLSLPGIFHEISGSRHRHQPKLRPRLTKVAQFLHFSFLVFSMLRPAGHINNFNKFVPADHKYPDFDASSEKFPMKNEIRKASYSNVTG